MRTIPVISALLILALANPLARAGDANLIVHEWGTFTSFQDQNGKTISGINVDDEPVPKFVHRLGDVPIFTTSSTPARWSQGAPGCHPDVTLRLETPVLYFYPQVGYRDEQFDVQVSFAGGWLTEFYPFASALNSGFPNALQQTTRGTLQWTELNLVKDSVNLPVTQEHVWLAPRAVQASVVSESRKGEAEKYLFYRGVGHLDAPLLVREDTGSIAVSLRDSDLEKLPVIWVVRVQSDGRVRYTRVKGGGNSATAKIPTDSLSPSNLDSLRADLKQALLAEGLFAPEAQAMLATWQLSYFESEGTRLFFVLPRHWTDARLPLSISVPAAVTRVMLGRIEIVSAYQQQVLRRLKELPASEFDILPLYTQSAEALQNMQTGNKSHSELYRSVGRKVPEALQLYESLGRFRDALLVHEWKSSHDEAVRSRLQKIMRLFSACEPDLGEAALIRTATE